LDHVDEKSLHDHTYGITSDPLTQFAVVFSAHIHDVDHTGLPNAQLVKERTSVAVAYNNKSVVAWDLLMREPYMHLCQALYTTKQEFTCFHCLVVNSVMVTDIMDK
jgi:hypothetical protein